MTAQRDLDKVSEEQRAGLVDSIPFSNNILKNISSAFLDMGKSRPLNTCSRIE